jgi:tellurium resistance protein TerD
MTISLEKGGNISLAKVAPGLTKVRVGLGWDVRTTNGEDFDLDASALLLKDDGKVRSDADFIFYGQLSDADGSVTHQGDNRTGAGDGDDEQVVVDLAKVPADVDKVAVVVSIHEAAARNQNFGGVRNSYVRLINEDTQEEIAKYELNEDSATENAIIFAELYRKDGGWKFRAVGLGYIDGLAGIARDFGVNVG